MDNSGSKIYVVDDDEGVRDSLTILCKSEGWQVDAFENGREFLDAFDPAQNGCLLLDLNMPVMNGHELIKILNTRGYSIPVIVITSDEDARTKSRLLDLGVIAVFNKPLDHDLLFDTINRVV